MGEYGARILTGILCYDVQEWRPWLLYHGRLQDSHGRAEGCLLPVCDVSEGASGTRWPQWHDADLQT